MGSYERKEFVQKFTFHRIPATFDEAKRICKQEGGNLAVVTSREAENEMLALWKRSGPVVNPSHGLNAQAFIGIELTSKGWQTTFGDRPPYLNWSLNWWGRRQPDSPTIQKCGSLLKQGGMDDVHCYYKLAFFSTFDEANQICKQEGGNLAVVTSREAENEMLALWKRSGPVVNPTQGLNAQAFIGIQLTSKGWQTYFGENPPYFNWSSTWCGHQQPDNPAMQKCGSLLKQGGMDDVECHYKLAFFCEKLESPKY
ncbi:hypothetical protein HW555_009328 [Spodoptera exigua]|uniref:C-type lectin domain-containing protein n=1 Tax=Spodoptera exigua TaxID=7107 RepID=A0A835G9F6_SPOEX|nr:hypothetical protein HW555_009328 [Spodoptera exigua]